MGRSFLPKCSDAPGTQQLRGGVIAMMHRMVETFIPVPGALSRLWFAKEGSGIEQASTCSDPISFGFLGEGLLSVAYLESI